MFHCKGVLQVFTSLCLGTSIALGAPITTLYTFQGEPNDGTNPAGGVIRDSIGNLYGTTGSGGNGTCGTGNYCGIVYQLTPNGNAWNESVLYNFQGGTSGYSPSGNLVMDSSGNLYGTTFYGGKSPTQCQAENGGYGGCGVVFKLSKINGLWTETVLYKFKGGSDGQWPAAGLLLDSSGNLYGTTTAGGAYNNTYCTGGTGTEIGCGTIFKISPGGTETALYSFCAEANCSDGAIPEANLIIDSSGNLYGTAFLGGNNTGSCATQVSCGTVFELSSSGAYTVLHAFDWTDGSGPKGGLLLNGSTLYGTTSAGGPSYEHQEGVLYKITSGGTYSVLHQFASQDFSDGIAPWAPPVVAPSSGAGVMLVGTTTEGGDDTYCYTTGCGVIYQFSTGTSSYSTLHTFEDSDGADPAAGLIVGPSSAAYGTTVGGGSGNAGGTVYQLTLPAQN